MNFLTDLANNPIITILTCGFYVKDLLAGWGQSTLGWILCIAIEITLILLILKFLSWVYQTAKSIINSFRK